MPLPFSGLPRLREAARWRAGIAERPAGQRQARWASV